MTTKTEPHTPEIAKNADGHIQPVYGRCAVCNQLVKWDDYSHSPGHWVHFRDDDAHNAGYREGEKWGRDQGRRDGERDGQYAMKMAAIEHLRQGGHVFAASWLESMVLGREGCDKHSTFNSGCHECGEVDYDWPRTGARRARAQPSSGTPVRRLPQRAHGASGTGPRSRKSSYPAVVNYDATVDAEAACALPKLLGVKPATIRSWAFRGLVHSVGVDHRGRRLYRIGDLVECAATRRARPAPGRPVEAVQH